MDDNIVCQFCGSDNIEINSMYTYVCLSCGEYNDFEDAYEENEDHKSTRKLKEREGWD